MTVVHHLWPSPNVSNLVFDGRTIVIFLKKDSNSEKNLVYDTDAVAFKKITEKCDIKPWSFADKGKDKESDADADAPNAVKISLKATLTEDESKYFLLMLNMFLFHS